MNSNKVRFSLVAVSLFLSMFLFAEYSQKQKDEKLSNFIKATKTIDDKIRKYEKDLPKNIQINNVTYNVLYNDVGDFEIVNFIEKTYCNQEILISKSENSTASTIKLLKIKCKDNSTIVNYEVTTYFKEPMEDM